MGVSKYTILLFLSRKLSQVEMCWWCIGRSQKVIDECLEQFGYHYVEILLAHTIRSRKAVLRRKDLILWADTIPMISQPVGYENDKRDYHELRLKISDRRLCKMCDYVLGAKLDYFKAGINYV